MQATVTDVNAPLSDKSQKDDSSDSTLKDVPQKWTPGGSAGSASKGYRPIKPDFSKSPDKKPAVSYLGIVTHI